MKKSGMTIVFVIICIGVLVAAYGVGVCIKEIRFYYAKSGADVAANSEKTIAASQSQSAGEKPEPAAEGRESDARSLSADRGPEDRPPRPTMGGPGGASGMPTKEQLENMSEEEKREAFALMRERFGGRRRGEGSQLSDEDRIKMREELEKLRENSGELSEEERAKERAKILEKYGITLRRPGGRFGGERGLGGGGRRRRPDDGQ